MASRSDAGSSDAFRWTRLPLGDGRCFVYSPRFGRTYLLPVELATSSVLPLLLGLRAANHRETLSDHAVCVDFVGALEKPLIPLRGKSSGTKRAENVGWFLPLLYLFFHRYRTIASISRALFLVRCLARFGSGRRQWSAIEIGRAVMAVEDKVGISDCYPRALLTAYLCLSARLGCRVAVGILAPTANMHAWCSTGGIIPYEPASVHWWYSPLAMFDVLR